MVIMQIDSRKISLNPLSNKGAFVKWQGSCISLPGCVTEGVTLDQVLINMQSQINIYISNLNRQGKPIPQTDATI